MGRVALPVRRVTPDGNIAHVGVHMAGRRMGDDGDAVPAADQHVQRSIVCGGVGHAGHIAVVVEQGVQRPLLLGLAVCLNEDEFLVLDVLYGDVGRLGQRVILRDHQRQGDVLLDYIGAQQVAGVVVQRGALHHERHVHLVGHDAGGGHITALPPQPDGDARIFFAADLVDPVEHVHEIDDLLGTVGVEDGQRAHQRLAGGGAALQVAAVDEEVVGLGKEGDTGGCQLQVLFFAGEQLYTQLVFHVLDSLAQAGLGHAQFLGRTGDVQAFCYLYEILQFIYEHNATLHFPWYYLTFQSL